MIIGLFSVNVPIDCIVGEADVDTNEGVACCTGVDEGEVGGTSVVDCTSGTGICAADADDAGVFECADVCEVIGADEDVCCG